MPLKQAVGKSAAKRAKSSSTLLSNMVEESIERIVAELRKNPAKAFITEQFIQNDCNMEPPKNEGAASSKPFPDSYNIFKLIPRDFKQSVVVSLAADKFSDDAIPRILAKDKDAFNKVFYFVMALAPTSTVPKVSRDKEICRRMLAQRYEQICSAAGKQLLDDVLVKVDGTLDLSRMSWFSLQRSADGANYSHLCFNNAAATKVALDPVLKADCWRLDIGYVLEEATVYKSLANGKRAMPQVCSSFFAEGAFDAYDASALAKIAKDIHTAMAWSGAASSFESSPASKAPSPCSTPAAKRPRSSAASDVGTPASEQMTEPAEPDEVEPVSEPPR